MTNPSGVSTVVFNTDRTQVLLQKREDFRIWGLPGGLVEPNEQPAQAAVREIHEETGYHAEIVCQFAVYTRPRMIHKSGMPNLSETWAYIGRVVSDVVDETDGESVAVEWFDVDALPQRTVPFLAEVVQDAYHFDLNSNSPIRKTLTLPAWKVWLWRRLVTLRNLRNRLGFGPSSRISPNKRRQQN